MLPVHETALGMRILHTKLLISTQKQQCLGDFTSLGHMGKGDRAVITDATNQTPGNGCADRFGLALTHAVQYVLVAKRTDTRSQQRSLFISWLLSAPGSEKVTGRSLVSFSFFSYLGLGAQMEDPFSYFFYTNL
jgi:hypothetical protein